MKKNKIRTGIKGLIALLAIVAFVSAIYIIQPFSKAEQTNAAGKRAAIAEVLEIQEAKIDTVQRIYVGTPSADSGEGTAPSGSRENPVETLQDAYNLLPNNGGIIVLLENKTIESWPSLNSNKPAVVMGDTGTEVITLTGIELKFNGNIGLLDIKLNCSYNSSTPAYFYANGHTMILGSEGENNFKIIRADGSKYWPTIFGGGERGTTVDSTNVKIYSGCYNQIFSGGQASCTVTGKANLLIDGGNKKSNNIVFNTQFISLNTRQIIAGSVAQGVLNIGESNLTVKNVTVTTISNINNNILGDVHLTLENINANNIYAMDGGNKIGGNIYIDINGVTCNGSLYNNTTSVLVSNDTLEYNLTVNNSKFTGIYGGYYLKTNNVNIEIIDSQLTTLNSFTNNKKDQNIRLKGVQLTDPLIINPSAGITQLTIENTGTSDLPIKIAESTHNQTVNLNATGSCIELQNKMILNDVTIKNTYISLTDQTILNINGTYEGNSESTICITPKSQAIFDGSVKGTTGLDINNSNEYGTIEAILANCENGKDSFVDANNKFFPEKTLHIDNTIITTHITWRVYYDYEFSNENVAIYIDGDNGKDIYEEEVANQNIGSSQYPVKSLSKAYSLLSDTCNTIVLVGNVYIGDTESSDLVELPELPGWISNKDDYTVTITATDGVYDFYNRTGLYFLSSGTTTRNYQCNSNIILKNIRLINSTSATETSVPNGKRNLYAGGYRLIISEHVECDLQTSTSTGDVRSKRRFCLFAGPYAKTVSKSYLEVNSGQWNGINITGGKNGIIGDSSNTKHSEDEEPVLTLKVNGGILTSLNENVSTNSTTVYGNVCVELGAKEENSKAYPVFNNSSGTSSYLLGDATIYGNASVKFINKYTWADRFYIILLNNTKLYGNMTFNTLKNKEFSLYSSMQTGNGIVDGNVTANINGFSQGIIVNNGLKTTINSNINFNMNNAVEFKAINIPDNKNLLGNINIHFYGSLKVAGYQKNPYEYLPSNGKASIYYHGQKVSIDSIKNFNVYAQSSEDGTPTQLTVKKASDYKNIEIDSNSSIYFAKETTINGNLTVKKDAQCVVDGKSLAITGNLIGEEGTIIYNGTTEATITGKATGTTFIGTTKEEVKFVANKESLENAFVSSEPEKIQITSELAEENRIWQIRCLKIVDLVYIKDDGNDLKSGESTENAVATLERAFSLVPPDGTIVICGPLTIESWPGNACKNVTITSKVEIPSEGDEKKYIDYREENNGNAVVTFKSSARIGTGQNLGIHFDADFWFKELAINIESDNYVLFCRGNNVVFGVEGDNDSIKILGNKKFYIYGGSATGGDTDINFTINAGNFGIIHLGPRANSSTNATFTLNGGSITNVSAGHYSSIKGDVTININGGTVNGNIMPNDTSGNIYGNCYINVRNNAKFGTNSNIYVGGQNVEDAHYVLNVEGNSELINIPNVFMGSHQTSNKYETVGNIKNALIKNLYASGDGTGVTKYPIKLNLAGETTINNFYGGPKKSGSIASTVDVTIKDNAKIENFYRELNGRRADTINIIFENYGSEEEPKIVTNTYEGLDNLIIGENAYVSLEQENGTFAFNNLSVLTGGQAYFSKPYTLNGNYIGSDTKESAGYIYLKDGSLFKVGGTVQGYTILRCSDKENYASEDGIIVISEKVTDEDAKNYFTVETGEMQYATSSTSSIWQVRSADDTIDRNIVYVSSSGNDGTSGTARVPVKTINGAYSKVESLYNMNYKLLDAAQKENIDTNGYKIILLDDISVTTGDTNISEHPSYKVTITSDQNLDSTLGEDEVGSILFSDDSQNAIYFAGTTLLEHLNINSTLGNYVRPIFAANGFSVTFGKDINITAPINKYPEIYGGKYSGEAVNGTDLTVESGKYSMIYGGGYSTAVNGNVNLVLGSEENNSGPDTFDIGEYNQSYTGVFGGGFNGVVTGNINVTVHGGKYHRITGGGKQATASVTGNINLDFKSGETSRIYGAGESAVVNGNVTTIIGSGISNKIATVTEYLRGSGMYEGLAEGNVATVVIKDGSVLPVNTQVAAGGYQGNVSKSVLKIEGGTIECDVFGGGWGLSGDPTKGISKETLVNVTGGTITGSIYGGGFAGEVKAKATVNIEQGEYTNVFGGGFGETAIAESTEVIVNGGTINKIFGGGNLAKVNNSKVIIKGGISENVYGGGNLAGAENSSLQLELGEVTNIYGGAYGENASVSESIINTTGGNAINIYGGGDLGNVTKTNITINGGNFQNIYGGGNLADVGETNVNINKGTITGNVYGGGNQASSTTTLINIGDSADNTTDSITIDGNVFGGNNNSSLETKDSIEEVTININKDVETTTKTNIYGGCNFKGLILNNVTINVNAKLTGDVYGAGFGENTFVGLKDSNTDKIILRIGESGNIEGSLYGGGNAGKVDLTPEIVILGKVQNVYGAGYGEKSNVDGSSKIRIGSTENKEAAIVGNIFGGGYSGNLTHDSNITLLSGTVENIYGGGLESSVNETNIDLLGGTSKNVYGGGYEGNITTSNINVKGSNILNALYGGGYNGEVQGNSNITILKGQIGTNETKTDSAIYGGGYGETAIVSGNTNLTINGDENNLEDIYVYGSVYGGGNDGDVYGNSYVKIYNAIITNSVYGGGNAANIGQSEETVDKYHGNSYVEFTKGIVGEIILNGEEKTYTGELFGGGNLGAVFGNTEVLAGDEDAKDEVTLNGEMYAGGKGYQGLTTVYGESNATIAGIDTQIAKYGSIERGEVKGDVNITFKNYKNISVEDRYKGMSGINKATNMNLIDSFVNLTEGLTQIHNVSIPFGSGLMISQDSNISGNFQGGGVLYLRSGICFTIEGDLKGNNSTVLLINPEITQDKTYSIIGSKEKPYIKILGNDSMNGNAFVSGYVNVYKIYHENPSDSDAKSIYYVLRDFTISKYLQQDGLIDSGKIYTRKITNADDIHILNTGSFTTDINLKYQMIQKVDALTGNEELGDGSFTNVHRSLMIESAGAKVKLPKNTSIILIVNANKYWYKTEEENQISIEFSKFKVWDENVSYEAETRYFQEVTDVYANKKLVMAGPATNEYEYNETFRFIIDFSNADRNMEEGVYNLIISAYDDSGENPGEIYNMFKANYIEMEGRNYEIKMRDGETSYFTKNIYNKIDKVEMNALLTLNKVSAYNQSDIGKKVKAMLTLQKEDTGEVVNMPAGTVVYVNGNRYQPNGNSCLVTLIEELEAKSYKHNLDIVLDFSGTILTKEFIEIGNYKLNIDLYLANEDNHIISKKLYYAKAEGLNLVDLTKYGINAEVISNNNTEEDHILLIDQKETVEKKISLTYQLSDTNSNNTGNEGEIIITSQRKLNSDMFAYENIGSLVTDDTITVSSTDKGTQTREISLVFSDKLENGTYRVIFTLYDSLGNKLTDVKLNFIVAR